MAQYWQEIVTFLIVAAAALAVGRRVLTLVKGFRKGGSVADLDDEVSACSGCDSCGLRKPALHGRLVSIALNAPKRILLPMAVGAHHDADQRN